MLNSTGGTITTYALMDGLGRQIQTQEGMDGTDPSTGSPKVTGTVITDTFYDGAGRVVLADNPYGTPSALPSINRFPTENATQVPSQTQTAYDGAARVVTVSQLGLNTATSTFGPLWSTTNSYLGVDRVDTTPPDGGTYTSTYTDSRGHTKELAQYTGASFAGTPNSTKYNYDVRGDLISMADQPGHSWTWTFDLLGRQVSATDPDTGTTTTTYDPNGNITDTVDADQHKLHFDYDDLNRKTAESEWQSGPAAFAQVAAWTYDSATLGKGLPAGSTRYVGSTPTTPGTAYSSAVSSYNANGNPLATSLSIPAWAGSSTPSTYNWAYTYNQAGIISSITDPAAGGVGAEKITTKYDLLGQVYAVGGYAAYLANALHTHTNQPALLQLTDGVSEVDRSYSYDDATARLTELRVTTSATTGYHLADHLYTYKNDGELSQDSNTADGQGTDTQCYRYDQLQQLTQAWTPASTNCTTDPTSATLGGPAPYWTEYSGDPATGNRLSVINHATTSMGLDTKHVYNYPGSGSSQPHAVSSIDNYTAPAGNTSFMPVGSNTYSYDPSGNTTSRPGQTLAWDSQNHLATATTSAGAAGNVYDADGNLLLQTDPNSGSTLFLGDTEVHVPPGSSIPTGVRTYTAYGSPIAERLTTVAAPTTVVQYWLDASPYGQNTVDEEVRSSDLATTHRYFDPYGNPRGSTPTWTSNHTFLNAPSNATTGTIHLGARDYDANLGRFISADPLLNTADPLQVNGYSYASNNPVNQLDPSGLLAGCADSCTATSSAAQGDSVGEAPGVKTSNTDPGVTVDQGGAVVSYPDGVFGSDDGKSQTILGIPLPKTKWTHVDFLPFLAGFDQYYQQHVHDNSTDPDYEPDLIAVRGMLEGYCDTVAHCYSGDILMAGVRVDALVAGSSVSLAGGLAAWKISGGFAGLGKGRQKDTSSCGGESFTPETNVLMADGTTKRLDQIQVGDKVQATDPATGEASAQTVAKVWVNHDTDLMNLTIHANGKTSIIHSTQHHPFWNATRHAW
ncbi:MAG: RHS repeat-associated core domain-containing protein, partial [Jatrophihabitantaceae bacterium]